jgi:predicted dehydrogenase
LSREGRQLGVAIVGCGLIGRKRARALAPDRLVATFDVSREAAESLASEYGAVACESLDAVWRLEPDVVVVATVHRDLGTISCQGLEAGAHVLVEKPAGIGTNDIQHIIGTAERTGKLVKVGFNHRFHPGIARAITAARSGTYGEILYLRGRYGHGGRLGYEQEWRTDPALSGGGELIDQGIHLLDLSYWLLGDVPLRFGLVRTQFWDAPVEDNAVIILGDTGGVGSKAPFALLHASWTEWKNTFSIEIACQTAKFAVDGLTGSYGRQVLTIYTMRSELGPPDTEVIKYPFSDSSWAAEWKHFRSVIESEGTEALLGDLGSARYCWRVVEEALDTAGDPSSERWRSHVV